MGAIQSHPDLTPLYQSLSPDEQSRAHRFLSDAPRQIFVESRFILRTILGRLLHQSPGHIEFGYTPLGKPFLADSIHHEKIEFNLSHANEYGLFIFYRDAPIGIDIEFDNRQIAYREMIPFVFTPSESNFLTSLPQEQILSEFFTIWTVKEALAKATGLGFSLPFNRLEVLSENGTVRDQIHIKLGTNLDQHYRLVTLPVPQNYHAAAAFAISEATHPVRFTHYIFPD
jgi:4'-phosphopantetheinyl transferase